MIITSVVRNYIAGKQCRRLIKIINENIDTHEKLYFYRYTFLCLIKDIDLPNPTISINTGYDCNISSTVQEVFPEKETLEKARQMLDVVADVYYTNIKCCFTRTYFSKVTVLVLSLPYIIFTIRPEMEQNSRGDYSLRVLAEIRKKRQ